MYIARSMSRSGFLKKSFYSDFVWATTLKPFKVKTWILEHRKIKLSNGFTK